MADSATENMSSTSRKRKRGQMNGPERVGATSIAEPNLTPVPNRTERREDSAVAPSPKRVKSSSEPGVRSSRTSAHTPNEIYTKGAAKTSIHESDTKSAATTGRYAAAKVACSGEGSRAGTEGSQKSGVHTGSASDDPVEGLQEGWPTTSGSIHSMYRQPMSTTKLAGLPESVDSLENTHEAGESTPQTNAGRVPSAPIQASLALTGRIEGDSDKVATPTLCPRSGMVTASGQEDQYDRSSCVSDGYHAIHCRSSTCQQCARRRLAFKFWDVGQTQEDEDIWTPGDPGLVRVYDGEHNVLAMLFTKDLMETVKKSVVQGRRYRAIKKNIDRELDQSARNAWPAWQEYRTAMETLKAVDRLVKRQSFSLNGSQARQYNELLVDFKRKQHAYRTYRTHDRILKTKLRKAEREWSAAMRHVEFEHQAILEDVGVLSDHEGPIWANRDYEDHSNIRSRIYEDGDLYVGEDTDAGILDDHELPTTPENFFKDGYHPHGHGRNLYECGDELQACEAKLQEARKNHEDITDNYDALFGFYVEDHPGRDLNELANEYGPQFVELRRNYIRKLKQAEEALENARAAIAVYFRFSSGMKELQKDMIERENEASMAKVNRKSIESWQEVEMDVLSIPETIPDAEPVAKAMAFGSGLGTQDATQSSETAAIAEVETDNDIASEMYLTVGLFGNRGRARVGDAFHDSVSVFDEDSTNRRRIDDWAKAVRGGAY